MEAETEKHPRKQKPPKMAIYALVGAYREGRTDAEARAEPVKSETGGPWSVPKIPNS